GATVVLAATGSGNTLTQPAGPTNASGVATGTLSSTVAGSKTVSATINGVAITQTATVTVTAGSVSASQSSVTASPTSITAGSGTSTITVTARDANGNPISGATVVLSATGTGNTLTQPASPTNASGVATGSLSSTVAGSKTVSATISGVAITQTATVTVTTPTGDLTVTASTTGQSLDPDGYTVTVDGGNSRAIGINGSTTYTGLSATSHTVALSGVASNCTVSGGNSQTVTVQAGTTVTKTFSVTCTTPPGTLSVTASTGGSSLDPDGYTVTVGGQSKAIGTNATISFSLAPGSYTATLSGVATNCTVSGGTSRSVTITSGQTTSITYSVTCTSPNSAPVVNAGPDDTALTGLLYSFSWSFSDANNNGPWSYTVDWGDGSRTTNSVSSQGTYSSGHTYVIVLPTSFTIRVTVTDAAGASGSDTKVVQVLLL
ncbi:MAG TPA: invasin domain 3-containing protein, partial [Gemmatimonadales bacterium]|nr:invasin domain 3-containing protein [Gemmatimonadales bacterium]